MARHAQVRHDIQAAARKLWDSVNELQAIQKEWNALSYGTTMPNEEGLPTTLEYGAVAFDTANAVQTVLNAGHATNIAKVL